MLWVMFIPIFKLLTLKLSNHWIAQFYEAISLNFRLIKYSDAWKLTFFSLKISWNDFKVKYAWLEVKECLQAKFGVNWGIEWGFKGGLKNVKMLKNCSKLVFSDPHKIPLSNSIDPKFFLLTLFDFNSNIFFFEIIWRSFKTEKSQFSHIDTLYEAKFCWNCFIKLSDPLVAQFKQFLRSECTKGSRIPKYLPWRGGICGQIIFAK